MRIITQTTIDRRHVYFAKELSPLGKAVFSVIRYDYRILERRGVHRNGITLLDGNGHVLIDPSDYLSSTRQHLPYATRRQMACALRLFYIFCEIHGYSPKALSGEKVDELMAFMYGISVQDEPGRIPRVIRSARTVNGYFGMIRRFVETKGWSLEGFNRTHDVTVTTPLGAEIAFERIVKKNDHTLKTGTVTERNTPMHVTPEQMRRMATLMRDAGDRTSLIVSHLQYSYGLRSGESLGLTGEDIVFEIGEKGPVYKLILRNRISDRLDQSCKGLLHPFDPKQYKTSGYKNSKWEIEISQSTYDRLMAYIDYIRNVWLKTATKKQRRNYEKDTLADSVTNPEHPGNRYIFIGGNGRRLSGQTWNNHLGYYMQAVGLDLDIDSKSTNCSHRLRHGFAMFHAQYSSHPMTIYELKGALRHASITTCLIYYTPLPEEQIKMKMAFQEEIENLIPEFDIDRFPKQ